MNNPFSPLLPQEKTPVVKLQDCWEPFPTVPDNAAKPRFFHRTHGEATTTYVYRNAEGLLLGYVCRFEMKDSNGNPLKDVDGKHKKEILPLTYCRNTDNVATAWRWKGFAEPRPLYGLHLLANEPDKPVLVTEGEKACDAAQKLLPGYVVVTSPGGSNAAHKADWTPLKGKQVVIWPDNDVAGQRYLETVKKLALEGGALSVRVPSIPEGKPEGWDAADALAEGWGEEEAEAFIEGIIETQSDHSLLKVVNIQELLAMDIKPQEMILHPVIPKQGVAMVYAYRGIGKTHVALGIAYAVASGGSFLKWKAPKPRKVLYIDGEMPARVIQERLAREVARCAAEPPSPDYLRILTPDFQEFGIPSLSDSKGQKIIDALLDGVELVIIDNISTLCRGGRENESESWSPIQEWALYLRKIGISVLFIHHAGKNNQQRGNSKKEDIMDTVISLKRPEGYESCQGARFEVHYEKARGIIGEDAAPFEAWLKTEGNVATWVMQDLQDVEKLAIIRLAKDGLSTRDIGAELGISKTKASNIIKKSKEDGSYAEIE